MMAGEKELHLRHELKYEIDTLQHQVLQKKLSTLLKPDPNMESNSRYNVRNLYFDDFRDTALCEKQAGVSNRKKYRIRIYNHSDAVIKFERKTKINQYILKESTRITRGEADRIIAGDFNFLAKSKDRLLRDFYLESRCNLMRPVVIVEYEREAYIHPVGNVRITFDTDLRTGLGPTSFFDCNICTMGVVNRPDIILEIKYNEVLPQYICGLFPNTIRPRVAIGKFVLCRTQQKCQTGSTLGGIPCTKCDKALV
ncbi:MAG: polyphosphate polymerase domain-containing protein [Promethearchaeota archaeon]